MPFPVHDSDKPQFELNVVELRDNFNIDTTGMNHIIFVMQIYLHHHCIIAEFLLN